MEWKEELLPTAFRAARSKRKRAEDLGITPKTTQKKLEAIVLKRTKQKVQENGGKLSDYLAGQEFYINSLFKAVCMSKNTLLQEEYNELNINNSSFEELAEML